MHLPDYHGGSIVNLMRSIESGLDARPCAEAQAYPGLREFPVDLLPRARNVVLLIVDGLGYNYLRQHGMGSTLLAGLKTPLTSVFPSTTASAVSTFLTGVGPQQHALTGWHSWWRELGCVASTLRFRARHGGDAFSRTGIDARSIYTAEPMFDRLTAQTYVVSPEKIIESDYNRAHCGVALRRPYRELAEMFARIGDIVAADRERKFIHAYTYAFDDAAHTHGAASPELQATFRSIDGAYAELVRALAGSDTALLVTADHGFVDSPREACIDLADHPLLEQMLTLPLCGERRIAYCYVQPGAERAFESYVGREFAHCAQLARSADLLARGWFGLGPTHARLAERIGDYTLVMKDNHTIKDWVLGEQRHLTLGVHGGTSGDEMLVPLIWTRL